MEISFTDAELQDLGINIQPSLDDSRNDDQFEAYQYCTSISLMSRFLLSCCGKPISSCYGGPTASLVIISVHTSLTWEWVEKSKHPAR